MTRDGQTEMSALVKIMEHRITRIMPAMGGVKRPRREHSDRSTLYGRRRPL